MEFVNANHRQQTPTHLNNFGPRGGLAYNITRGTVIRAAYGIVYAPSAMQAAGPSGAIGLAGFRTTSLVPNPFYGVITDPTSTLSQPMVQFSQVGFLGAIGGTKLDSYNRRLDPSLMKNFRFGPEQRYTIQFRAKAFGAFNAPQFGAPGNTVGTPIFGVINNAGGLRVVQMALKVPW